jgi:hypothetical protein
MRALFELEEAIEFSIVIVIFIMGVAWALSLFR